MRAKDVLHVYDKTFCQNYYICYGMSRKRFVEVLDKNGTTTRLSKNQLGCTVMDYKGRMWVWTLRKNAPILAHELLHAVLFSMRDHGLTVSDSSDEVYTYTLEMLMRETLKWKAKK